MSPGNRQNALLVLALLGVGAVAWGLQLRAPLAVDAQSLGELPVVLAGWRGRDVPIEETVERMLRADFHVQRAYLNPAGGLVWLYVGYYGTRRGGRSEHSPWVCYPAAGWEIQQAEARVLDVPGGGGRVNEFVVERSGHRRLVHFWYRSYRRTHLVTELEHAWDRFVGRLVRGRADGAFVRISAPLDRETEDAVRARLFAFGRALDDELGRHWPSEHPVTERTQTEQPASQPGPEAARSEARA